MAIPVFPESLPGVSLGSYSFTPVTSTIRTDMEAGVARTRRRFVSAPTDYKVVWKFTMSELAIFEEFYKDQLFDGASWFELNLVNGVGQNTVVARFKEPFNAQADAKEFFWLVTATIEAADRPTGPQELAVNNDYDLLELNADGDTFAY